MLTFAFCTFNRRARLETLVRAMRAQQCSVPFEILAVDNNSTDGTPEMLERLAREPGIPLRWVTETEQGIVPARNRAIVESLASDILVFIDDDELPEPGLLEAAARAILDQGAYCVRGPIRIDFTPNDRPRWLGDELIGFLGALDHGPTPRWVTDDTTPVWSGNIAYRVSVLRTNPELRFDKRYNRAGVGIGGGSDAIMFRTFLARDLKIRYRPDMVIRHLVDEWKLKRSYFIRLHYRGGLRAGRYQLPTYPRTVLGLPPFLVMQCMRQLSNAGVALLSNRSGSVRQGMNAAHALGCVIGYLQRRARSHLINT